MVLVSEPREGERESENQREAERYQKMKSIENEKKSAKYVRWLKVPLRQFFNAVGRQLTFITQGCTHSTISRILLGRCSHAKQQNSKCVTD